MTPRVDISRERCERMSKALLTDDWASVRRAVPDVAALILALRAALDAAEAARQSDADFWQQEIARMADPVGYARGVRDAARVASMAHMVPPDGGSPTEDECAVAAAAEQHILALLPADAAAEKPCGGCGATKEAERCLNCLHDFGTQKGNPDDR